MNACARFEEEGLTAVEAGAPLDEHFDKCPACRAERTEYERLGAALATVNADDLPPGDWQARVWARIRREEKSRSRRRLWTLVPVGLAAVLGAAVLLTPRTATPPTLLAEVESGGGPVRRGAEAQPGDRLRLAATGGGLEFFELRVYLNDRDLVLRCSDQPPCERRRDRVGATVELDAIGTYQPVFLASGEPLPEPGAGLDADVGSAMRAGVTVELPPPIEVR